MNKNTELSAEINSPDSLNTSERSSDTVETLLDAEQLISETRSSIEKSGIEGNIEQHIGDALAYVSNETIAGADSDASRTSSEQDEIDKVVIATELQSVGAQLLDKESDPVAVLFAAGNEKDIIHGIAEIAKLDMESAELLARDVDAIKEKTISHPEAERSFNETLTKIEGLRDLVGHGVSESSIEYEDKTVPIFDFEGAPIKLLVTDLRFRGGKLAYDNFLAGGEPSMSYIARAIEVQINPQAWIDGPQGLRDSPSADKSYISTNYIDSNKNLFLWDGKKIATKIGYVFDQLREGDLMAMANHDLVVGGASKVEEGAYKDYSIDSLHDDVYWGHNEVALRRYSAQTGEPKTPNAIMISKNAAEDDVRLASMHAAFYNIPIVRIDGMKY